MQRFDTFCGFCGINRVKFSMFCARRNVPLRFHVIRTFCDKGSYCNPTLVICITEMSKAYSCIRSFTVRTNMGSIQSIEDQFRIDQLSQDTTGTFLLNQWQSLKKNLISLDNAISMGFCMKLNHHSLQ